MSLEVLHHDKKLQDEKLEVEILIGTVDLPEEYRPEVPVLHSFHTPSVHLEVLPSVAQSCEVLGTEVPVARA